MGGKRRHLTAVVDEAQNAERTFYVMAAAIVDPGGIGSLMRQVEREAPRGKDGQPYVHANELWASDRDRLDRLEQLIGRHDAVRFIATVRAPIDAEGVEGARQRCLAHLAVEVATRHRVGRLVIDSRDDVRLTAQEAARYHGPFDPRDRSTIAALVGAGELPREFHTQHRDDRHTHQLWLADIAAYAAQQAIRADDPDRLVNLAQKYQLIEASRLPLEQRSTPHHVHAHSQLPVALDRLRALAVKIEAIGMRNEVDPAVRAHGRDLGRRAEENLERIDRHVARTHPPALEHYTRLEGPDSEREW